MAAGINGAPVAVADTASVSEDAVLQASGNVLTNDSDPESDALTVSAVNGQAARVGVAVAGTYGSLTLGANGAYSYILNNASPQVQALVAGQTVQESFGYTLSDGHGHTATSTLAVNIAGANEAVASGLSFATATRGVVANLTTGTWSSAPRILPFGDSITNGDSPNGQDEHGYRGYLWSNLLAQNKLFDFVGPNSNGLIPDPNHAGYPGERANDLLDILPNLLTSYPADAILLMAGTNDILQEARAQNSVGTEIQAMLDLVAQRSPATHVYVSTLIPVSGSIAETSAVNDVIRTVVASAVARGQNVSQVEMPNISTSDLFDGIHPNEGGYIKMAGNWTSALLNSPPTGPSSNTIDPATTAITGSPQIDLLVGDGRANTLSGGAGNDRLVGASGNDVLTGGTGGDTFAFGTNFGRDLITDFRGAEDRLDLRSLNLSVGGFPSWLQSHAASSGTDVVVTINAGDTITLSNVALSSLQEGNFLFS